MDPGFHRGDGGMRGDGGYNGVMNEAPGWRAGMPGWRAESITSASCKHWWQTSQWALMVSLSNHGAASFDRLRMRRGN